MKKNLRAGLLVMLASAIAFSGVFGQLTLTTSPYVQNFDGIGTGLPTGWSVRTGATGSALGTTATLQTAATAWGVTSGNFRNVASATGLTAASDATAQAASTNRALAVRQTAGFGDNSAAFTLEIDNTSGKANFALSFLLQSLDVASPRQATWQVQVATGDAPTTFETIATTPATLTTGGSTFSSTTVAVDFGNKLDNKAEKVWIRVVVLAATTGTGNRPTTGLDDFSLTWTSSGAPAIGLSGTSLTLPSAAINTTSAAATYNVLGSNLTGNLSLSTAAPFEISKDGSTYGTELTYSPAEALANPQVFVRFTPLVAGVANGAILHSSPGAASRSLTLAGDGFDPSVLQFNFDACTPGALPGSGFSTFSVEGDQVWQCSTFGNNGTNGAQINGFASGAARLNEDWLISPPLNLSTFTLPVLSFYSISTFSGPGLQLLVSTNYSGTGNPNAANWTPLPANFPSVASNVWQLSDNIPLLDYTTNNVFIAFKYTSSPEAGASRWTVDDISIRNAATLFAASPASLQFGEVNVGTSSTPQNVQVRSVGYGNLTFTAPAPFEVSWNGAPFGATASIPESNAAAGATLAVRVSPVEKKVLISGILKVEGTDLQKDVATLEASSLPKDKTLDVATYNVFFLGNTITNDGPADRNLQRQNIAEVIRNLQPDIVGVQEVSSEAGLDALMTELGGSYEYILSNRWARSFEGPDPTFPPQRVGFIFKKDVVTLIGARVLFEEMYDAARAGAPTPLSSYPTGMASSFYASGRLPYMANFKVTVDGLTKEMRAIVLHAKSGGSQLIDWQRRAFDAKALKDSIDAYYASDPVLILGDFNDRLAGSINAGQPSSYTVFLDDATNYRGITLEADQAGRSSFLGSGGNMIDHMIASNEWFTEYLEGTAVPVDVRSFISNYAATTSDHLPVVARFELKIASVLPVRLMHFEGRWRKNEILLEWSTVAEVNASHFVVERADAQGSFSPITTVPARGNTSGRVLYWAEDAYPQIGANFYRLKMVDKDGAFAYSSTIRVDKSAAADEGVLKVWPNPVSGGQLRIQYPDAGRRLEVTLTDAGGRVVGAARGTLQHVNNQLQQQVAQLPAGLYHLVLTEGSMRQSSKIVVAR